MHCNGWSKLPNIHTGIRERKIPHNFHRMSLCFVSNYDLALSSIGRNSFITILLTCSQMRRQSIYVVLCRITGKHQISDMKIRIKTYIFMDKKLSFFLNMLINTYTDKRCLNVYILRFFQKYRNLSYGSKSFFQIRVLLKSVTIKELLIWLIRFSWRDKSSSDGTIEGFLTKFLLSFTRQNLSRAAPT